MKVIELRAENIKRLVAVQIKPEGNFVQVTGENEQGKTSVLDAIWWALGGEREIQTMPIRLGQEKAKIELDLGEFTVIRRFTAREGGTFSSTLEIRNAEGFKASSPQALLDKMIGKLAMDPLAFLKAKSDEQAHQIRSLVPGFDFAKNDADLKKTFDARTEIGRQIRQLEGQLAGFNDLPAEIPEWRDPKDLLMKLDTAHHFNAAIDDDMRRREDEKRQLQAMMDHIVEIQKQMLALKEERDEHYKAIAILEQRIEKGQVMLNDASADCDAFETKIKTQAEPLQKADTEEIRKEMDQLQVDNALAERAKRRHQVFEQVESQKEDYDALTKALELRKAAETTAIAEAKLPVEGLGFGPHGVTINGHPLDQASASQQLRLSVAIARAQNSKLRVMRIIDGSLLGRAQMAELEAIANEHDYQIWIERVATGEDIGVVIEEGRVKGQDLPAPDEKQQSADAVASADKAAT